MINPKTLKTLEFNKILQRLEEFASFSAGKEAVLALQPATDLSVARSWQRQTTEARRLLESQPSLHLGGAHDIRSAVRRAEIGAILTPAELLEVAGTLTAAHRFRAAAYREEDLPWLRRQADRLAENRDLVATLEHTFSERGDVLDSASPALRRIRSEMRSAEGRITERLNSMVSSSEYRTALQEPIVTMRNGRHVIPVRNEYKGKVPGIVHDQSSSGQTLFIEPLVVTEMNNRLRELELAEQREIERILQELSQRVAAQAPQLRSTVEALRDVDVAFARAKYAGALRAAEPALNDQGRIVLEGARHPLLTGDVVPLSLTLGEEFRVLIITGPNTGGKTVALKTVGLLTLMAQAGMHIPAAEGSQIAVFPHIFADIGDEQSIEQSLSTFSSHMRNIIDMLPRVDRQCLVLLDELGAGTDPSEGAALARAILTTLVESEARAIVTTHYSELKTFAHEERGVENASVEFDVETLSPTYRLVVGLPGRSQAISIAKRLGMPQRVLALARQHVSAGAARVERLLSQIQSERQEIARLAERARTMHEDAAKIRDRIRAELVRLQQDRERILAEAQEEAAATVRQMRAELRQLEEEARGAASRREQRELRGRVDEVQNRAATKLGVTTAPARDELRPIEAGATVEVLSLGQQGQVLSVGDGEAEVQVGLFKMRLPTADLRALGRKERKAERAVEFHTVSEAPPMEIDVRGWRADDVVRELDQYLHDNYLHGQGTVRIVHGKGTGALRKAIRDQLASHPLVKSYEAEKPQQGGEGVTVVKLAV